ncbi:ArnT family glycosyltransferase [Aquabacter spiritensis]|uniref:Dolichyl-phosphate-mannose-protein mannosyltransferase n=1 Tax=Aquabacter spiritensis TaxID=933073 RepID=A0A4R3LT10_9HYPH|nr:glycosyltransferase family 39 protein [Aquabacter spiritensis]TCT02986.1 dolichyl-phosphate-mannose-protein mannosyltransferase [Aquabacter spiritensis]
MRFFRAELPTALADRCALLAIAAAGVVALFTFGDYGLGWDDFTHSQYGDLLYRYFASGLVFQRVFSFVNLYYYGGGFDLAATLIAKWLPIDTFDGRRLLGAFIGMVGLLVVWRTGRRIGGPVCGLVAVCLLLICPLYYGHIFMNAKDAPFAVAVATLVYAMVRALDEYPTPSWRTVALFGLSLGLAVGSRVLGLIALAYAGLAVLLLFGLEWRGLGFKAAGLRLLGALGLMALGLPLAYLVLGVVWPWAVVEPLNPIHALSYYSHFWEVPWRELYEGRPILVPDMPRTYVPTLFAVQMPELFLGLALAGAAGALVGALAGKAPPTRRAQLMLIAAAALFPILLTVATRPVMYNGIRHFVFVTPALAVLGGLAGAWIWGALARRTLALRAAAAAVFAGGLIVPAVELAQLHPYQYTYYNHFVGGVRGADDKFMLDYWGLAFKQAAAELDEYVDEHRRSLPQGRKFRVAVCGPHRAAAAELGPRYETTYDTFGADFALMLGEFYCATVPAPVIVKIERDGVVYARVYDTRGRSFPSVFAAGQ